MAGYRVSVLFSVLAVLLAAEAAGRQKMSARDAGGLLSEASIEEYLEDQKTKVEPPSENASPLQLYLHLLRLKRREQIKTAEKVLSVQDYSQQYKTVTLLLDTLFPALQESIGEIEKASYTPGMPFPKNRDLQEEVGKVYENMLMFGDFLLRMPEITKKLYGKHKEWTGIFRWALKFCMQSTDVFTGPYSTHLHLMMQELGIGVPDPNYVNPFGSKEQARLKTEDENVKERVQSKREAMQQKMKNTKGPRLRTNRHNEL